MLFYYNYMIGRAMFIKKEVFGILVLFIISIITANKFIDYIDNKITALKVEHYKQERKVQHKAFLTLLNSEQETTTSIALSLSTAAFLKEALSTSSSTAPSSLEQVMSKLQQSKKNQKIKIGFIHRNGKKRDYIKGKQRETLGDATDMQKQIKDPKIVNTMSIKQSGVMFKSIVPIFDMNKTFLGTVTVLKPFEVITHKLEKMKLSALLLIDKESKKHLTQAINQHSIDEYALFGFNTHAEHHRMIKKEGLDYFITPQRYRFYQNHFITTFKIKDTYSNQQGYYLLIKAMDQSSYKTISTLLSYLPTILLIVSLFALLFLFKFYQNKQAIDSQSKYFKEVINAAIDIIIVTNKEDIIDINQAFFKFFDEYETIEAFAQEHGSIANLFKQEEGFIQKQMGPYSWIEYMHYHKNSEHQVKILYKNKEYIFSIKTQALSNHSPQSTIYTEELFTVVLTNITGIKEYQEELEELSKIDMLTKIGNKAFLNQQLTMEIARAQRYGTELTVMMFDIDNFKKITKLHGDSAGDELLVKVTQFTQKHLRAGDVFCRYGGDQFMIIMPNIKELGAVKLANRLCANIEAFDIDPIGNIKVSVGLAEFREGDWSERVVERLQRSLQQSKTKELDTYEK